MHRTWRAAGLTAGAAAAGMLAACTSFAGTGTADGSTSAGSTPAAATASSSGPAQGASGTTAARPVTDPSHVATDPTRTVAPSTTAANILISYAGWNAQLGAVMVGGYINGIVETDGTCTLTLTKGSTSVKTSKPGTPDVGSTDCGGLSIPRSKLSSGTWSAQVTYASRTSSGSSTPQAVTVP